MTVIRPNSISGVTSITAQGGEISYFKSDGTRGNQFTHNIHSTGVVTATSFSGSGANLTSLSAANLTGALPAISGANLTSLSAANLTGALPAISGANLTGLNSDVVSDTSPQLGGNLDVNSKKIVFGDSSGATDNRLTFGASNDLQLFHATAGISTIMHYHSGGEPLHITSNGDVKFKVNANSSGTSGEDGLIIKSNGAVELYHDNRLRAYTVSNAFYVEQSELNDDCDVLVTNKSTTLGNNQKSQISLRVQKDAGGSHGGTNRTATFGHNYNASTGGGGFFTIRSNDGTHRDFYMDNNTNLRVNYGHSNIGTSNGTVVGSQSSDIRNKNLVGDGTVSYGLSEVLQLNPIKYQYKKELVDRIGFSAQQVEPIIPESVYDTKQDQDNEGNTVSGDTIKAMYYVDLIPVLVNAIKELKAENDALKKRLDDGGL